MKSKTFGPTLLLMAGRSLALLGSFALPLLLVRIFAPAEFGTYKQLSLVFMTVYLVAQFGMSESLYYFIPMHPREAGRHSANASLALGGMGLAAGVAIVVSGSLLAAGFNNPALAGAAGALAAFTGLTLAATPLETVMVARKRYALAATAYGLTDLLRAASLAAGALAFRSVQGMFLVGAAFAALRLVLMLAYLAWEFAGALRPGLGPFLAQAGYALPFAAAVVLEVAQNTYHQYAVSFAFDAAAFAVYAVGCLQLPFVDLVAGPAVNVMMVSMGEQRREGQGAQLVALWHETTRRLAIVFFPAAGLMGILAGDLIPLLFTESYRASVPILHVWVLTIALSSFMTDGVLRVYADTGAILWLNLLRLASNVVLIATLVGSFGLLGVALATVLAIALAKAAALARIAKLTGAGLAGVLPWRELGRVALATVLAGVLALAVRASLHGPVPVVLLATAASFTAAFIAFGLGFDLVTGEERRALADWLRRRKGAAPCAA
jgi:O-antigen/teichoic acid export membrane protein